MKKEAFPDIVTQEKWEEAHDNFLAKEKRFTKAYDKLSSERRRLPMEVFRTDYDFNSAVGKKDLAGLFEGRRQLLLYNFMFQPGKPPCVGCSMFVDNLPHPAHLHARDTTLALISPAKVGEIEAYKKRMDWILPWYSSFGTNFNEDTGVGSGHRMTVFVRNEQGVYRTYHTNNRGTELLGTIWALLDLTPLGRQETWEDTPEGRPQTPPYQWWRKHDEY